MTETPAEPKTAPAESQMAPKQHPLLEALQDQVFQDALAKVLAEPLGDDRDAAIAALLKSKGLDSMTEEDILSVLNPPPDTDSDLTKQLGQEGGGVKEPPAFSFSMYEVTYTITSASHPDGVFEIEVKNGTVIMGEEAGGRSYTATAKLDSSNKWWVTWGDKAAGDWFSVQFFSTIPQGSDKTPLLTFKGTWHTNKDGKPVALAFDGKYNLVARKDTSEEVVKSQKIVATVIIYYLLVGVALYALHRYNRREAAARGVVVEQVAGYQRVQEAAIVNQDGLIEELRLEQERRSEAVAKEYLKNLPREIIADFEARLTERMNEVVEDYYQAPEHKDLWEQQQGQPPNEAIQEQIEAVISEHVKGLVTATQAQIARGLGTVFVVALSEGVKEALAKEVEKKIEEHAIDTLIAPEGGYKGLAKIAYDRVTTVKYTEYAMAHAGSELSLAMGSLRSMGGNGPGNVFNKLVNLAEKLHEPPLEGQVAQHIMEKRRTEFVKELQKLEQDLGAKNAELAHVQNLLREEAKAAKEFRESGEALKNLEERETTERHNAEHEMRELKVREHMRHGR